MYVDLAHLTDDNGAIPRGRWLFIVCGAANIASGVTSGAPILISPESAAGIKAGAKTGLSTLVCGMFFGAAAFFSPLFAEVPGAGTAPLLIMVGVLLFQNVKRIDWGYIGYAVPSYLCLFFIPFTYSILRGVVIGFITYIVIGMFTGDFWVQCSEFVKEYFAPPIVSLKSDDDTPNVPNAPDEKKSCVRRLFDYVASMDMTHTDANISAISHEYNSSSAKKSVPGIIEDMLHHNHLLARQATLTKYQDASENIRQVLLRGDTLLRERRLSSQDLRSSSTDNVEMGANGSFERSFKRPTGRLSSAFGPTSVPEDEEVKVHL